MFQGGYGGKSFRDMGLRAKKKLRVRSAKKVV
jgi:hypothetical protein